MTMASKSILIFILFFSHFSGQVLADCVADPCIDNEKALSLKHIAFICLFMANMLGFWLRTVKGFNPDQSNFVIMKALASGVILATGFVHVLPNSFEMLSRSCLDPTPGHLFAAFSVLCNAIIWMMFDSFSQVSQDIGGSREVEAVEAGGAVPKFQRFRVMARFLELSKSGCLASVCITLGGSNHTCSIKGLITALCVHQIFQGMEYADDLNLTTDFNLIEKAITAIFLSILTPLVIALGMLLNLLSSYKENSPDNISDVGYSNALAAGQLIYVALVGLLAADFMGTKLQQDVPLQIKSYVAVLLGAVGMSVMALIWAN